MTRPVPEGLRGKVRLTFWTKYGALTGFIVSCAILSMVQPRFLTYMNLMNVARQVSIIGIIATGMTFVIISGGVDLSVGTVAALAGCVAAGTMLRSGVLTGIVLGMIIGGICGFINGLVIMYGKAPPFIATLGMQTIARGAVLIYTDGQTIPNLPQRFVEIGTGWLFGFVPIPVVIAGIVLLIGNVVLNNTQFGLHVLATGGNQEGARLSGVNVVRTRIAVHSISGFLAALGGIVLTARVFSGQPTLGVGLDLQAVAATVIGGTAMGGGQGSMSGTLLGTMIMGVLTNGLNLVGVSAYWQEVVIGSIIITAVVLDNIRRR